MRRREIGVARGPQRHGTCSPRMAQPILTCQGECTMKKLKLDPAELRIETFPAVAIGAALRGTVAACAITTNCPPPSEVHSLCHTCEIYC